MMKKSWHWLLYLDFLLPLLLFFLAWLLKDNPFGSGIARVFHAYGLYVIQPIPNPAKLIGVAGLLLHLAALGWAIRRKDLPDLLISASITVLVCLYFALELNYAVIRILHFSA